MSFMFNPYPYADPDAVNLVTGMGVKPTQSLAETARRVADMVLAGRRVGLDAYPGADVMSLVNTVRNLCAGQAVRYVDAASLLKTPEEITQLLKPYLPEDREVDPVLLYGRRYRDGYRGLQVEKKVEALKTELQTPGAALVFGAGALAPELQSSYDVHIWMDITPRNAVLAYKNGHARNIGAGEPLTFNLTMRRNYYVDFETAMEQRWGLIRSGTMDYYITADIPEKMQMVSFADLKKLLDEIVVRPFRCRPVYLEGVWGGWYIHRLRHLPKEMRNCAWVFDMIPLEVSLVAKTESYEFELPFFTFVQVEGETLLGKRAYEEFGGYFPIRFNYDDTFHSSGNMSIQCHPDGPYVTANHDELGRQDESYYVCVTGQDAKTYLGFQNEGSCEEFFREARRVEHTGEKIDYDQYVNHVPSKPGTQVMIPAGTIHASGRNQVVLEIGSLTVGSYTYKLYDYQRIDPGTGLARPIHLKMGADVIRGERTREWVYDNLVDHGGVVRQGDDWKEIVKGEHDLLYFSLRNLVFNTTVEDDTDGLFHVLALVDGEKVRVESINDPSKYYLMNSMDMVVIPANLGRYRLINLGQGTVTVHKTHLKKEK